MASHNELGKEAEDMAVNYLVEKGYKVLHRNWRYSHHEIDIIAERKGMLKIVEVKALRTSKVYFPEKAVTKDKFNSLRKAADEFLFRNRQYKHIQFDILSIIAHPEKEAEFFLIEDVFM